MITYLSVSSLMVCGLLLVCGLVFADPRIVIIILCVCELFATNEKLLFYTGDFFKFSYPFSD